jgi:hypothetical protein
MAYKSRKDIKVPESYIQKIRDTKTKSAALEKYGNSTDPKMREALRRFYGSAAAPTALKDSSRTRERTLPKKSVAMKTVAQAKPSRTGATPARGNTPYKPTKSATKSTTATKKTSVQQPVRGLPGGVTMKKGDGAKVVKSYATIIGTVTPIGKAGMLGKAAYSAAAKQTGIKALKAGVKKGIATKGELSAARGMARGMVKDTVKLKSKTATVKASNMVKRNTKNATSIQRANSIRKASKAGK